MTSKQSFEIRYQPTSIEEFIFPSQKCEEEFLTWLNVMPSTPLLIYGNYGTGKSTLAKMLYSTLYPGMESRGLITVIGADCQGNRVAKIKEIRSACNSSWWACDSMPVIIIDELDNYPIAVQKSMKSILDKYQRYCHFVFTTNHLEQVDEGLLSRVHDIHVGEANREGWIGRASWILQQEGINEPDFDHVPRLIDRANGDCREILRQLAVWVWRERSHAA